MNQNQDRQVVLSVVRILGIVALLAVAGVIFIVGLAQVQHKKVDGAAIGIVAGFAGTAIGAIGSLLVNTKTNESNAEAGVAIAPEPVVLEAPAPIVVGGGDGTVATAGPKLSELAHLQIPPEQDAGNGAPIAHEVAPVRDEAAFAAAEAGEPPPIG